ncbi:circumsporozoite protein [Stylonychia lemnae]|uniref:RING-type E3 ubiquitin transferase n=1 Tax=Stylonychia lemnae TaxID=5949 RepID=A0A078B2L1_STYLE|nr:circumsporozoite protein [Stylonychia lemnae]|eukprot:CDW88719.1 circumsporozoite protein [Stylonychia lemnae]
MQSSDLIFPNNAPRPENEDLNAIPQRRSTSARVVSNNDDGDLIYQQRRVPINQRSIANLNQGGISRSQVSQSDRNIQYPNFADGMYYTGVGGPHQPQPYDEYESALSYILINAFVAISIIMISIFEDENQCTKNIHRWLFAYIALLVLDSAIKLLNLKRTRFTRQMKMLATIMEFFSDALQVAWLIYGNVLFLKETKECLSNSPLLTYTLLFVLILGFIHLAKFTFIILGIMIWAVAKCFGVDFSFEEILATGRENQLQTQNQQQNMLNQPLFEKGLGLQQKAIDKLKETKYSKFVSEMEVQFSKQKSTCNIFPFIEHKNQEHLESLMLQQMMSDIQDMCSICCSYFVGSDDIKYLPCHEQHIYHSVCITEWLLRNDQCPLCKRQVLVSE